MPAGRDPPFPTLEDFGLPPDRGLMWVRIPDRHRPGDCLSLVLAWIGPPSGHQSDRTVVLELRDPGGQVVDRAAKAVGCLSEERLFQISVRPTRREPDRYVARLEIHQPDASPRVFEWPLELPDPSLFLAATLSLSAATAAPGDKLELTVHNTGRTPLSFGERYDLQRWREDGAGWEHAPGVYSFLAVGLKLPPGSSYSQRVDVPRPARPGRHRIVKEFATLWAHGTVRASVEFDVVARASQ